MRSESAGPASASGARQRRGAAPPSLGVRSGGVNKERRGERDGAARRDVDAARWEHDLFDDAGEEARPLHSAAAGRRDLRAQLSARAHAAARSRAGPQSDLRSTLLPCASLTVAQLLDTLNLSRYLPLFEAEDVDMAALALCTEEDLQALGVPLGPRKKILAMVSKG